MPKKMIIMGVIAGFLFSVLAVGDVFAITKDKIILDVSYGEVELSHKKHVETYKIDCVKCHHTWKKGETAGRICKNCHKAKIEGKNLPAKEVFHKNCKGCHNELKKFSKPTGPTGCTQCHVKKK